MSAFAFGLLQSIVLVEIYEGNLSSHTYIVQKGKSLLITISDHYGIL